MSSALQCTISHFDREENPMSAPLTLPCGLRLPNRIVKVAMEECLADFGGGRPTEGHSRLYEIWARGGWGMVITGNVQIASSFLSTPWDLVIPSTLPSETSSVDHLAWTWLAHRFNDVACRSDTNPFGFSRTPLIVQLSHPGRQSPLFCRPAFARPPSASEIRVNSKEGFLAGLFNALMFRSPREMSDKEVEEVIERFGESAEFLEQVGVHGVEVHGAHGYLIAQFLSPATNHRPPSSRFSLNPSSHPKFELLRLLLASIRRHTSRSFCVGIKLSCGDFTCGGLSAEDALEQVQAVREMTVRRDGSSDEEGWDFIEISGGAYEKPLFASTSGPNLPFVSFSTRVLSLSCTANPSPPPILLSSSIRSLNGLTSALSLPNQAADLLGFARPSLLHPSLPLTHLVMPNPPVPIPKHEIPNYKFWSWVLSGGGRVRLVGAGLGTIWYNWAIGRIARGLEVKRDMGVWEGFLGEYGSWLGTRLALVAAVLWMGAQWWTPGRG